MIVVLPHVPCNIPKLLDDCCEPSFSGELAVLKVMPMAHPFAQHPVKAASQPIDLEDPAFSKGCCWPIQGLPVVSPLSVTLGGCGRPQ
jgi:hypothetical protein